MTDETLLNRNLLALASRNPNLSREIGSAVKSDTIKMLLSKSGKIVPAIVKTGRELPLHSLFDPVKEGQKFSESYSGGGYLVFFGFGAGYHIHPFLKRKDISNILIIDRDVSVFKELFSVMDFRNFILEPRITFLVDMKPESIKEYILSNYFPAITGDLQTISLRSRFQTENDYFTAAASAIKECLGVLADDYTVQAYFGKKWFINSISNLKIAQTAATTLKPVRRALITGAGPSLEIQVDRIATLRKGGFLIATDTSLPSLMLYGLKPDLVISIDCQHISYHHFLSGFPRDIPLVLDLASPPDLTRLSEKVVFITSGHPFSQYLNTHWRKFPYIDISGGNVSHAAISLADSLGAEEIYLFGTDFSFPEGKSYARGTYLYPYFQFREDKFRSLENQFFAFLLRNNHIVKDRIGDTIRYTTKPMISYKERLEQASGSLSSRIVPVPGKGVPLRVDEKSGLSRARKVVHTIFSAGSPACDWKEFLTNYCKELENLTPPEEPLARYFRDLKSSERDVWTTLFPAAAALRREHGSRGVNGIEILIEVKKWSQEVIRKQLVKTA
ncbi:MAG: 6-hydroxymethylpterin diphosphokinase MptE-like protein [Spirochaetota bacterium]